MTQKIGIALIHGAGNEPPDFAERSIEQMRGAFAKHFSRGAAPLDDLVFKPVFWGDILNSGEDKLWSALQMTGELRWNRVRRFMLEFLGDVVAYQPSATRRQNYDRVHERLAETLKTLADTPDVGAQGPLCVIGHSLGTIIAHNYFFDMTYRLAPSGQSALELGHTLTLFYTLGSPLAIWSLRYAQDYKPLPFPGREVRTFFPHAKPKWVNFYDRDDVFANPVRVLSEEHVQLIRDQILFDQQVDSGYFGVSWTPFSHLHYWTDTDVTTPIAADLAQLWKTLNTQA